MAKDNQEVQTSTQRNRSDQSRQALILAAVKVFGEFGLDGSRSRVLAEAAGVNVALINYHFGGKQGLYLAMLENIGDRVMSQISPTLDRIQDQMVTIGNDQRKLKEFSIASLEMLLFGMLMMFLSKEVTSFSIIIDREQQRPTEGFNVLYRKFLGIVITNITALVAAAKGLDENSEDARLSAVMLVGQVLVFRSAYATVTKFMKWDEIDEEQVAMIKKQISETIKATLSVDEHA